MHIFPVRRSRKKETFRSSRWCVDQNHRRRSFNNFNPYTLVENSMACVFELSVVKSNIDQNRASCRIHPSSPEGLVP